MSLNDTLLYVMRLALAKRTNNVHELVIEAKL